MPYQQFFIDPNTGATYPTSYVRVTFAQADHPNNRAGLQVSRYVSLTTYSLGMQPVQEIDINVAGSAYVSAFAAQVGNALGSFNSNLKSLADTFVGALPTFSGAIPTP